MTTFGDKPVIGSEDSEESYLNFGALGGPNNQILLFAREKDLRRCKTCDRVADLNDPRFMCESQEYYFYGEVCPMLQAILMRSFQPTPDVEDVEDWEECGNSCSLPSKTKEKDKDEGKSLLQLMLDDIV